MKAISTQTTLLCLTLFCTYQPPIKSSNFVADVQNAAKGAAAPLAETMHLNPQEFERRARQIFNAKLHIAEGLRFNQPNTRIIDSLISLEQILGAAKALVQIYDQDPTLKANIKFLEQIQNNSSVISLNSEQLKEAFYSLPFIKKLVLQEMMNKNMLKNEETQKTRPLSTNQDFKNAIQELQQDGLTRAIRPGAINWHNVAIVFDILTKNEQPATQPLPSSPREALAASAKAPAESPADAWFDKWFRNHL